MRKLMLPILAALITAAITAGFAAGAHLLAVTSG